VAMLVAFNVAAALGLVLIATKKRGAARPDSVWTVFGGRHGGGVFMGAGAGGLVFAIDWGGVAWQRRGC
jgi:hypothetical protein